MTRKYGESEPLHRAVERRQETRVRELIQKGITVDARDRRHVTPLMVAAEKGYDELVELLIQSGADINAKDRASGFEEGRRSSLHRACDAGQADMVERLLKLGADPDCLSQSFQTPLFLALLLERRDIAMRLLEHGASPNGPEKACQPPLVTAAANNDLVMIKELLKRGANPNCGALAATRSVECARELLRHGADVNAQDVDGNTPLLKNVRFAESELIRCYLDAGADVNVKDREEMPALMHLTDNPKVEIAELLLAAGAEVNAPTRSGVTILDHILGDTSHRHRKARQALVQHLRTKGAKTGRELRAQRQIPRKQQEDHRIDKEPSNSTITSGDEQFAKLRQMETNGANYALDTEDIIARLKAWQSLCSFRIVDAKHDTVVLEFDSLPADLDAFVKDLSEFCPDLIDQGAQCLPDLIDAQMKKGGPVPAEMESLVEGVDFQNEDFGPEILKRQLQQQRKLTLWWD